MIWARTRADSGGFTPGLGGYDSGMPAEAPSTVEPQSAAWSPTDLAGDPHRHTEKADKVRRMFAAIAQRYDLNNRLHSFGRDQAWRRAAVRMAGVRPTDDVLDVACGTGDLTRAFAEAGARSVTGLDFTPEMLAIARRKSSAAEPSAASDPSSGVGRCAITYIEGDAMALPFPEASFDVVSIAFGIRNVTDPARALREFRRVLRAGGRLIILEFGRPSFAPVAWMNDFYCSVIMPRTATLIAGDRSGAYHYLPKSVKTFLSKDAMRSAMEQAGFTGIVQKSMTLGVCLCHVGRVPS